jgi:hypothetical protein
MYAFFDIDEKYKAWVLRSAWKKWKDFKCWLKIKFYNPKLSTKRNVQNGCGKRIPPGQWAFLVRTWKTNKSKVFH